MDQALIGIRERIGVLPLAEESEEVRLELLRLTKALLFALPSSVREHIDHVASILEKSSYDKCPDVKKLASELIVWLSARPEVGRALSALQRCRACSQYALESASRNGTCRQGHAALAVCLASLAPVGWLSGACR